MSAKGAAVDPRDAQRAVAEVVARQGLEVPVQTRLLDLVSEVGELTRAVLKRSRYGGEPFRPSPEWTTELGDVLFALVCVANSSGIDLGAALDEAMEMYARRLTETGRPDSGR